MISFITLFLVGIGVGCFGALVGLGGGLIMVPLFMLTMMPPHGTTFETVQQVIGTSLFGVLLNAMSGSWAYWKSNLIMFRAAIPFAIATIPGAWLGGTLSNYFSGPGFSITFGVTLILMAAVMWWKKNSKRGSTPIEGFDPKTAKFNLWLGVFLSLFVGFISSILGIGGGIIHVPMMMFILGFPTIIATATIKAAKRTISTGRWPSSPSNAGSTKRQIHNAPKPNAQAQYRQMRPCRLNGRCE